MSKSIYIPLLSGVLAFTTFAQNPVAAQRRPRGVDSLIETTCKGGLYPIKKEIVIDRQIFTGVSMLSDGRGSIGYETVNVTCRLALSGETSQYRRLTLAFGLADNARENGWISSEGSIVKLSIYLNGQILKSQVIRQGDKFLLPIDVKGTTNVALEAECLQKSRKVIGFGCAPVVFFEDTLEK